MGNTSSYESVSNDSINTRNNSKLDEVNNKILYEYNKKFDNLYKLRLSLDEFIKNKEELVNKYNDEASLKDYTIIVLSSLIYIYIVLLILYGFYYIKLYGLDALIFFSILAIAYISFYAYVQYKDVNAKLLVNQNIQTTAIKMKNFTQDSIERIVPRQCPTKCLNKKMNNNNNNNNNNDNNNSNSAYSNIITRKQPSLKVSSQIDVWKYGDVPNDLFTKPEFNKDIYINPSEFERNYYNDKNYPKSNFDAPIKTGATYYKCDWLGEDGNTQMPNTENTKYTTIPCSYRDNFRESGKYFCPKGIDPNNSDISNCINVNY